MPLFEAHKEWTTRDDDRTALDRTSFGELLRKRFDMKRVGRRKVQTYFGVRPARADEIAEREGVVSMAEAD